MENKKTAVEWLEDKLNSVKPTQFCSIETIKEWIVQAKQIERDGIVQAYSNGWHDGQDVILNQVKHVDSGGDAAGEQYFNETYKSNENDRN